MESESVIEHWAGVTLPHPMALLFPDLPSAHRATFSQDLVTVFDRTSSIGRGTIGIEANARGTETRALVKRLQVAEDTQ